MRTIDISLPSSKSISNRALMIASLIYGPTPKYISKCDDTNIMYHTLKEIPYLYKLDVGDCGTAMRFLTAYLSIYGPERILTGSKRMKNRPIKPLVDALKSLGADIEYIGKEGYPPLKIRGHQLEGGSVKVNGSVSSQCVSALLMIAPMMKQCLIVEIEDDIVSLPYIDMTIKMMKRYGASIARNGNIISVNSDHYRNVGYKIEKDWSAASYFYSALSLLPCDDVQIRMKGLERPSIQGDSVVQELFREIGVETIWNDDKTILLRKSIKFIDYFDYDFINCPDILQTMVVCCCLNNIKFRFTGVSTLKIKETNRIEALITEMKKIGYVVDYDGTALTWNGTKCITSYAPINTYNDHRMAMAFAPVQLVHPEVFISDPDVVSKSFPDFWKEIQKLYTYIQ